MPDYSVFVLGKSDITVSNVDLDGVNQGSGVHMFGQTVTLNAPNWDEIQITDDDANFQDSDGSQRLNGAQAIDGTTYASNTVVEAEYAITLSDGTNTWTAIAFNVNNSSPVYGTIEGLAFIGGPGGFPPVGVELTVTATSEGPSFAAAAYATPVCYVHGTMIQTDRGLRVVEALRPGDRVKTADHGFQTVRWTGGREVLGVGRFAPVEIAAGVLGAVRPLRVSQQHRVLVTGYAPELLFGLPEVFVPAIHMVDGGAVRLMPGAEVSYHHLILDQHEVIFAEGVASESMFYDVTAAPLPDMGETISMAEFFDLPPLDRKAARKLARPCLRRHEAALLMDALREDPDWARPNEAVGLLRA